MRITSGFARGIFLDAPRGDNTRPATDAARQAIFSSIGDGIEGAKVLDLFAGTGSYGLEAASRGAASVVFAEFDRNALSVLKANIERVKKAVETAGGNFSARIVSCDCMKSASLFGSAGFDFIFADPPYAMLTDPKTCAKIFALFGKIAGKETIFALEAPAQFELPENNPEAQFGFETIKRLGKRSTGKPSQIIFKVKTI